MKPILVGIAGPKRSGKDTAARLLRQCLAEFDQDVLVGETAFADSLYDMIEVLVGEEAVLSLRNHDAKDTEAIEPYGVTLRHLADTLGTEWGRDLIHPDVWVMALYRKVLAATAKDGTDALPTVILIPDVRFPNEAELIRNNGLLLHIQRHGAKHQSPHRSAIPLEVDDTDTVIQNLGDLASFEQKVTSYGRTTFQEDLAAIIRASTGVGTLLSK